MVDDFIVLRRDQSAATEVSELLNWLRDLRSVYERGIRIRAKMQHNFDDSGGEASIDWSSLETLWGVPPGVDSVGSDSAGSTIYTYINGAVGSMEGAFQTPAVKNVTERVG